MMQAEIRQAKRPDRRHARGGRRPEDRMARQITYAGLGRRLANSIRNATYPKAGDSLNATALVWSKAPVIIGAHNAGPLIRSRDGFRLAIPTEAAGNFLRAADASPRRMGAPDRPGCASSIAGAGPACWWPRGG